MRILHGPEGNCPVQADGTIENVLFLFRARGYGWALTLENEDGELARVQCHYGPHFSAGWMKVDEARQCIEAAAPMALSLLALPNRRGEKQPEAESSRFDLEIAKIRADTRTVAELREDNAALRVRIRKLEKGGA